MIRGNSGKCSTIAVVALCLSMCLLYRSNILGSEATPALQMPSHWKVTTDIQVPANQVMAMSRKLGAELIGIRNIVYDVNGKRVQVNVIVTPDPTNAEKLMNRLRTMKSEEALLRKELTVYEFVGHNDALPVIAEGRKYIASM